MGFPDLDILWYKSFSSALVSVGAWWKLLHKALVLLRPISSLTIQCLFSAGVVKLIYDTVAYWLLWLFAGNHAQSSDVHETLLIILVLASNVNSTAAMCEQASPSPAMQVQWAHKTVPSISAATHGLRGVLDNLWECLTLALTTATYFSSPLQCGIWWTKTLLTQPLTKYL